MCNQFGFDARKPKTNQIDMQQERKQTLVRMEYNLRNTYKYILFKSKRTCE